MDSTVARPFDDSLREPPQIQSLRIAPLRQPVSSRTLSVPSPLEPNASGVRESNTSSKTNPSSSVTPATLPTLTELLDAARTKKNDTSVDSMLSLEPPPKPILPAFVNLRALERFPFSSFDDSSHARKRRRLEVQTDSFGEHLHLPIPQAQKEQKPPPFGPFAILNGLNEPPPNAALLPPIEAGSIPQLLNRPTKDGSAVEPSVPAISADGQNAEKREGKIDEILGSPLGDKASDLDRDQQKEEPKGNGHADQSEPENAKGDTESGQPQRGEWRDGSLSPKPRGRSRRNTRKWTEDETIDLLRGVVKCGIGNWKAILAQPDLKFDKRSASNLKDRYAFTVHRRGRANALKISFLLSLGLSVGLHAADCRVLLTRKGRPIRMKLRTDCTKHSPRPFNDSNRNVLITLLERSLNRIHSRFILALNRALCRGVQSSAQTDRQAPRRLPRYPMEITPSKTCRLNPTMRV
jgi:hypothetical protein